MYVRATEEQILMEEMRMRFLCKLRDFDDVSAMKLAAIAMRGKGERKIMARQAEKKPVGYRESRWDDRVLLTPVQQANSLLIHRDS